MKKLFILIFLLISIFAYGSYSNNFIFLDTAITVNAGITKVNGTDFTSKSHNVSNFSSAAITIKFTRSAGSSSTVDFEFQASYDGGTNWTTCYFFSVQVATNETAISNVVVKTILVNLNGISHLRLYRIVNNDSSNNLTICNAIISI